MMRRTLLILFCVIGLANSGNAQSDFRKGFIITLSKDTISGLVDYREGSKAHAVCEFKRSADQKSTSYAPDQLIGYGFIDDKYFDSRIITIDDVPSRVFLEVLVRGSVSLFINNSTFFIEKNGGGLQKLENESIKMIVDGKDVKRNTNQHIITLNLMLSDCAEVREKIQAIKLNEKKLTELVLAYNACNGQPSVVYKEKKPWIKATVGIMGGLNYSHLVFEPVEYPYDIDFGPFETDFSPLYGITFDVRFPRISEKISIGGDILYLNSKYYSYNKTMIYSSIVTDYIMLQSSDLKIPIFIRYTLSERKFIPYVSMGFSSTINLGSDTEWKQEVESNNMVSTENNIKWLFPKNQLGFIGSIGSSVSLGDKMVGFAELRYEWTNGISNKLALGRPASNPYPWIPQLVLVRYEQVSSSITNFQLLIGIRLK